MTVNIKGKDYTTCAERLQLVRESGKPFAILDSTPLMLGERIAWRVTIKVGEQVYAGSAECHLDAKPGSADATDPFACGETSAVARALGFAGFGSAETIASADEMQRGQPPVLKKRAFSVADGLMDIKPRLKALGFTDYREFYSQLTEDIGREIHQGKDITAGEWPIVLDWIQRQELAEAAKRQKKAS